MPEADTIQYGSFGRCCRITNGIIEALVTIDLGPRVIRFGFVGGKNEFVELPPQQINPASWNIYGGHRLWHAPEHPVRTYVPDNTAVAFEERDGAMVFTQNPEADTRIQKRITISMDANQPVAHVKHELINQSLWSVTLSPWALTVMASGGTAIMPLPPRGTHPEGLLPSNALVMWPYTDLSDERWTFGREYILLRQDPASDGGRPQKIGLSNARWLAYVNNGVMFAKTAPHADQEAYPDMGSAVEVFTNNEILELESLGPVVELKTDDSVAHIEKWALFNNVPAVSSDADVKAHVEPLLAGF